MVFPYIHIHRHSDTHIHTLTHTSQTHPYLYVEQSWLIIPFFGYTILEQCFAIIFIIIIIHLGLMYISVIKSSHGSYKYIYM